MYGTMTDMVNETINYISALCETLESREEEESLNLLYSVASTLEELLLGINEDDTVDIAELENVKTKIDSFRRRTIEHLIEDGANVINELQQLQNQLESFVRTKIA
jgi:ElaB/YqjD/DUF883 family membrane-anchored ribosome-binding protein